MTDIVCFLNMAMTNSICKWDLIKALPIKQAEKNILKGMRRCPQAIPAKSKRGFGIDAQNRTVQKPYFSMLS